MNTKLLKNLRKQVKRRYKVVKYEGGYAIKDRHRNCLILRYVNVTKDWLTKEFWKTTGFHAVAFLLMQIRIKRDKPTKTSYYRRASEYSPWLDPWAEYIRGWEW